MRGGLLAAAFLAVRVQGRHDGGRRAMRDGLLAAAGAGARLHAARARIDAASARC